MAKFLSDRQRTLSVGITNYTEGSTVLDITGNINVSGIVTAKSGAAVTYYGDGSKLTGVIGSIQSGSNVNVISSSGITTISSFIGINSGGISIGSGTTINFVGSGVTVKITNDIASITIPSTSKTTSTNTATQGQTTFYASYTVGYVDVYLNGSKLSQNEYTASNGSSIILDSGASLGDIVEIVAFTISSGISNSGGGGGGTPGGVDTQVQFNDGGSTFGGDAGLTYNQTTNVLSVSGSVKVGTGATLTSTGNASYTGILTASSFVKSGGTSSQFLKADGSVDSNTYATETYVGLATSGLASETYVNTQVGLATAGLLSQSGNGNNLTGIVTSITAGSGISVDQSTGNVTITATGGGGGGSNGFAVIAGMIF